MGVAQGKPLSYVPGGDLEGKIMPSFTLTENTDNHLITHVPVDWRVEPTGDAVHQIRLTAFLHAKGMPARYPGATTIVIDMDRATATRLYETRHQLLSMPGRNPDAGVLRGR